MGKRLKNSREKIIQRSVGFPMRVHEFLATHRNFQVDLFCRLAVDEQIAQIDPKYLKDGEKK